MYDCHSVHLYYYTIGREVGIIVSSSILLINNTHVYFVWPKKPSKIYHSSIAKFELRKYCVLCLSLNALSIDILFTMNDS